jgi:hypothetical protein
MPIYNNHKRTEDENWSRIIWRSEVIGECQKCKRGHRALLTIYGDRTELLRCLTCKSTQDFLIDPNIFDDAQRYPPFKSEDELNDLRSAWDSRYSKGYR